VQSGYESEDTIKPLEYSLQDGLSFDVTGETLDQKGNVRILFQPDGAISEDSPATFIVQHADQGETIEIAKTDQIGGYAITDRTAGGQSPKKKR
jgi:hypothetical protein